MLLLTVPEGGRPNFRRRESPRDSIRKVTKSSKAASGTFLRHGIGEAKQEPSFVAKDLAKQISFSCYISARQRTAFLDLFKVRKPHLNGVGEIPTQICTKTN